MPYLQKSSCIIFDTSKMAYLINSAMAKAVFIAYGAQ
jgi:hypothetical protein